MEKAKYTHVKVGAVDFRGRPAPPSTTGSWRAIPFLLALEICEAAGFAGLAVNIVTYLLQDAHFSYADAAVQTTNFLGVAYIVPIIAGFFADAYLGRFPAIVLFGVVEITGLVLMTLSAVVPSLRKTPPCVHATSVCPPVKGHQYSLLLAGMYLTAVGSGGVRVNLSSHGADQFDESDPKEKLRMSSFFNWFFFCLAIGWGVASTFLVYIEEYVSFGMGFGLAAGLVFVGLCIAIGGSPFYRYEVPVGSPLTRVAQVLVAAIRNRNKSLPSKETELYEVYWEDGALGERAAASRLAHTKEFRFLDKAAIVTPDSDASPWKLCTVTQVEEVKALTRMMPIWATTIMLNVCLAQLQTFSIEQGVTTDRRLGKNGSLQIPAASLIFFPVMMLMVLAPLYELLFVPLARKVTGRATGITHLQRIGVGLAMAVVSMTIAGAVERKRRKVVEDNGLTDNPQVLLGLVPIPMSVFWLVPQYLAFGIADLFTYVGMLEFFYLEAPDGMRSLGTGISQSTLALGYFLSSSIVNLVERATSHHGGGWLPQNLNRSRLDYFFWMLAVVNVINLCLFIVCAHFYKYRPRTQRSTSLVVHHHRTPDIASTPDRSIVPLLTPATPVRPSNASLTTDV